MLIKISINIANIPKKIVYFNLQIIFNITFYIYLIDITIIV